MQLFQKFLEIENESGYNILHLQSGGAMPQRVLALRPRE